MKALDKIVMPEATSLLRFTMTESVEYIRKDKVLEILRDSKHLADAALKINEL